MCDITRLDVDDLAYRIYSWEQSRKGGSAMSEKLAVVLTWAERIAAAIVIAVPAIRRIASELDAAKAETTLIRIGRE